LDNPFILVNRYWLLATAAQQLLEAPGMVEGRIGFGKLVHAGQLSAFSYEL
jgi:hypothetical protein